MTVTVVARILFFWWVKADTYFTFFALRLTWEHIWEAYMRRIYEKHIWEVYKIFHLLCIETPDEKSIQIDALSCCHHTAPGFVRIVICLIDASPSLFFTYLLCWTVSSISLSWTGCRGLELLLQYPWKVSFNTKLKQCQSFPLQSIRHWPWWQGLRQSQEGWYGNYNYNFWLFGFSSYCI